ncbi:hypothetical protein BDI01nite_20980 [Brevundimonas diminuta]|nr:hypothetical protein BDI01nite_20980 [Brevundimonas diminuta]
MASCNDSAKTGVAPIVNATSATEASARERFNMNLSLPDAPIRRACSALYPRSWRLGPPDAS